MPKKTFAEMLYEEKVLRGIGPELIQELLNLKEEDFGPAQTLEELFEELGILDEDDVDEVNN